MQPLCAPPLSKLLFVCFQSSLEESEDRYKSLQLQCKKSSEQCTADISVSKESYEKLQKRCQEGEAQMTSELFLSCVWHGQLCWCRSDTEAGSKCNQH